MKFSIKGKAPIAADHRLCMQEDLRNWTRWHPIQSPLFRFRRGATVVAVLVVLFIVCLLAHQTVKTMFLLRRGQDDSLKIAQAREILELGRQLERRLDGNLEQLTSSPVIVEMGMEFGKLVFSPNGRITATWPVDSSGEDLPHQLPTVVSWETPFSSSDTLAP